MKIKKWQKKAGIIFAALILLLTVFSIPFSVKAADKYMDGESAEYNIRLDENGNAHIKETWNCYFGGDTITRYRQKYKIPDNEFTIDVKSVSIDGEKLKLLDEPDESRPEGCAAVSEYEGGLAIEVYLNAYEESYELCFEYVVENAVILYDDVAEFKWVLVSSNNAFDVAELNGYIEIPYGTEENGLYFWGHGPQEDSSFYSVPDEDGMVNQFELYVPYAPMGELVSVRFAMPLELFPGGSRYGFGEGLDTIISEEQESEDSRDIEDLYENHDFDGEEEEYSNSSSNITATGMILDILFEVVGNILMFAPIALLPLVLLLNMFLSYFNRKRRLKKFRPVPQYNPDYYRKLPDDMKPALVYKLTSFYPKESYIVKKNGNIIASIFMDLIERGVIVYEHRYDDNIYLRVSKTEDITDTEKYTDYERELLGLLNEAGNGESITMEELNQYVRENRNITSEIKKNVFNSVEEEFNELGFVQNNTLKILKKPVFIIGAVLFGVFILLSELYSGTGFLFGLVFAVILGSIDMLIVKVIAESFVPPISYYNQEGEDRYTMWQAFARFLDDFTIFNERELEDVTVWRRYLVYAVALGRSKKVMQELKLSFPEIYETMVYDPYFADYDMFEDSFTNLDHEMGYTIRESSGSGSSFDDSYDGGDGGFSDGGGDYDSGSDGSDFD